MWRINSDGVILRTKPAGDAGDRSEGVIPERHRSGDATGSTAADTGGPVPGGECWICLNVIREGVATEGPQQLLRGCACRGTAGWAHLQCLVDAAKHKPSIWSQCPSCKQRYTGQLLLELSRRRWDDVRAFPMVAPERLDAANTLCLALHGCGLPREAAAIVESSLTACEAELGPDHLETLTALNNLAQAYQACGDSCRATGLAERAVAGYRRHLGDQNMNTLQALNNLGGLYMTRGKLDAATPLLEESLAGFRRVLGEGHRCTINCLHNLAGLHAEKGEFDQSIELLKLALKGSARTLGEEHPQTKTTARSLRKLEKARGYSMRVQRPAQIEFSEAVLELRQRVMWPDRPLSYSAVDGDDTEAQHYGIYARLTTSSVLWGETIEEKLVSVVSVWLCADGTEAQFRKFCTSTELQRKGLGVELLGFALASLRRGQPPIQRVWCNARVEQIGFYGKHFGLREIADSRFEKGGREYVLMERRYTAGSDDGT